MRTETALKKINCLAAAVRLRQGGFDETPRQQGQRKRLIAEIAATAKTLKPLEASANWQDQRVVNETWDTLWTRTKREMVIRKLTL